MQRLALMRHIRPGGLQALAVEKGLQRLEVALAQHPHADALAARAILGLLEHQAVMAGLLDAAQIERVAGLFGDHEADHLGVEQPARSRSLTVSTTWLDRVILNGVSRFFSGRSMADPAVVQGGWRAR